MNPPLPDDFDYIDLGILVDLLEALLECVSWRCGTYDEQPGESEIRDRAQRVLAGYREAAS